MGLFDSILKGTGNPEQDAAISRGLLQAGLQLMQARGKLFPALGQAGMAGVQATDQYRQQQLMQQRAALQEKMLRGQVDQQQRQAEIAALPGQFYRAPSQTGIDATGGMETSTDLPSNQGGPGGFDAEGYINALRSKAGVIRAAQERAVLFPAPERFKLGANERMYEGDRVVAENLGPPEKIDPNKPFMMKDGQIVPNPAYQAYAQRVAEAGATRVPVQINNGQKGLDNTLKLRGDFRSEPVYKAHQEMQSAYAQIQQSLRQASPAGDLAGATKIMKLLDPGSVVRESELGMAMAASGLLDRIENYAQNILKGTKLTPTQRQDFQRLADALYSESVKQYNAKRGEYQGIAERNQLPVEDVLGSPSAAPGGRVVNFGDLK